MRACVCLCETNERREIEVDGRAKVSFVHSASAAHSLSVIVHVAALNVVAHFLLKLIDNRCSKAHAYVCVYLCGYLCVCVGICVCMCSLSGTKVLIVRH